jgi:hypothetical protein
MNNRNPWNLERLRNKLTSLRLSTKVIFFLTGIASLVWFLFRVIPKPSRAGYPCMKVAMPIMSGFVIYLTTMAGSVFAFRKAFEKFMKFKYVAAFSLLFLAIAASFTFFAMDIRTVFASAATNLAVLESPNTPIGVAKGIFPGRVVWVMDKNSTNENCTNTAGDYWFSDENTDLGVVEKMLADGLIKISGQTTSAPAWDAIFKYFNANHGKGSVGYTTGEKIVIKINLTTMGAGGRHYNEAMDATPQLTMALLEQLIDTLNIAQADITIGDPYRGMPDEIYNPCHTKYPDVHYFEGAGTDGREQTEISADDEFFTSDDVFSSRLPQAYLDASYFINMPCLKTHNSAGITLAAKNHQGSVIGPDQDATGQYMGNYLHYDYPVDGGPANQVMGIYRHITDYMAHPKLGGNTLIYIVDAIWSGRNWDAVVDKFQMPPFDDDWTSSLFLSQDAVAIESVGFDFLYNEYKDYPASHGSANFPLVAGVQDYIHQAADPNNWPAGIEYDPSSASHSSPVGSLGVHEHWNNATNKQYTRNLGTGEGIELATVPSSLVITSVESPSAEQSNELTVFPNPVISAATLNYSLTSNASVHVELLTIDGKLVASFGNIQQTAGPNTFSLNVAKYDLSEGIYICKVIAKGESLKVFTSKILIK